MKSRYINYFRDHYDAGFTKNDIKREEKWFYSQWKFINSIVKIDENDKILEIGSGLGGIYKFLKNKNKYIGIELDKEATMFTNNYFKTNCFKNISIEEFNSEDKFKYIFAIEVLEHFDDVFANIRKIYSLLENHGIFIGTSPYPYKKNVYADKTHLFVLHPENWKRLFLNAGFSKVSLYRMSFVPFLWRIGKYLNPVLPFYNPINKTIATCLIIAER